MANHLLAVRGEDPTPKPVGICWALRFIKAQLELHTKWDRTLHLQRALCEDPTTIRVWYQRVEDTRQTYSILDENTYNFDETGFAIGIAGTSKVVTSIEIVGRAITIKLGNRIWVTSIECINACGWAISPFIILPSKVLTVRNNGWTTDALGFKWIQHFNPCTESRTLGRWRLLIPDGHSNHATPEFNTCCTQNKIHTICMPSYTPYLLQPLDIGCFSPLKAAYRNQIHELAR